MLAGGGPDHLDGGDGTDRVDYSNLNNGVTVGLDRHWLFDGSAGNDDLAGGDGADELWPGAGWDTVDGGAEPGDALAGDVLRYDDIERWVGQLSCDVSGCDFIYWELLGGGLTIDLDLGRVAVSVGYRYFGHNFEWSETDSAADIEAAYTTPLRTNRAGASPTLEQLLDRR